VKKLRPTKFVRGGRLRTIFDLLIIHRTGSHYVYWHGRPRHTAWMVNLSVAVVQSLVEHACLHEAVPNPAWGAYELARIARRNKKNEIPF
jgi:hypothetical protein